MTMAQAFECGDNDIPFIDGEYNCLKTNTKADLESFVVSVKNALSDKWQVQTVEPVVLSAEEMFSVSWSGRLVTRKNTVEYGEAMHQNGRLERDLEYRLAIKKVVKMSDNLPVETFAHLVEINIEPLNQDLKL